MVPEAFRRFSGSRGRKKKYVPPAMRATASSIPNQTRDVISLDCNRCPPKQAGAKGMGYNPGPMKQLFAVAAACLTFAVVVLLLSWTTYFSQFNSSAFDFTLRVAGEITPVSPTVIVAIDEDSVRRIGRWPWSRDKLA